MITWVLVFIVMLLVVLGMAVGVIMGRKPIAGSCGGIANLGIEKDDCPICGGNQDKCDEANREAGGTATSSLGYDAAQR